MGKFELNQQRAFKFFEPAQKSFLAGKDSEGKEVFNKTSKNPLLAMRLLKRLLLTATERIELEDELRADIASGKFQIADFIRKHDVHIEAADVAKKEILITDFFDPHTGNYGIALDFFIKACLQLAEIFGQQKTDEATKACLRSRMYAEIIDRCKKIPPDSYKMVDIWHNLANAHHQLKNYKEAITAAEKALFLNKANPLRYKNMATLLSESKADSEKIRIYTNMAKQTKIQEADYVKFQKDLAVLNKPAAAAAAAAEDPDDQKAPASAAASANDIRTAAGTKVKPEPRSQMFRNFRSSSLEARDAVKSPTPSPGTPTPSSASPPFPAAAAAASAVKKKDDKKYTGKRPGVSLQLGPASADGKADIAVQTAPEKSKAPAKAAAAAAAGANMSKHCQRVRQRYGSVVSPPKQPPAKKLKTADGSPAAAASSAALVANARAASIGKHDAATPPGSLRLRLTLTPSSTDANAGEDELPPTQPQYEVPETPPAVLAAKTNPPKFGL